MVRYNLAFLNSNRPGMQQELAWFQGRPGFEGVGLAVRSDSEAFVGHLRQARQMSARAVDDILKSDDKEGAALTSINSALREAEFENGAEARRNVAKALKLAPQSQAIEAEGALALAIAGDTPRAQVLARDLEKRFPLDTQVQSLWLPTIAARVALAAKKPTIAVGLLQKTAPMELGYVPFSVGLSCLYAIEVRGESYLALGEGALAAAEFQKILHHNGIAWDCPTSVLAQLGLARANTLQARTGQGAAADASRTRAIAAYQSFLTLWKDADPNVPILKEAKAEYAKLLQ